jgi:hypothetical protein
MVAELSKALTRIGEVLPRIQINLVLYRSKWMQDSVSRLYAHILLFLQSAVRWYNSGRAQRVVSSIFRPYPLVFREIVDQIKECTSNMDSISNTSSQAEIRGITWALQDHGIRLHESDQKLNDMQQRLRDMQDVGLRYETLIKRLVQVAEGKLIIALIRSAD